MLPISQSSLVLKTSRTLPHFHSSALPRRSRRLLFAVAIKPKSRLHWVGLSGSFCNKALMCRSVEVSLVAMSASFSVPLTFLKRTAFSRMASWIHNQRTWMCLVFPTPVREHIHNRCRRVRLDVDVDGSLPSPSNMCFCEDSSCRAIHDSVELCFCGTQGSHLIRCNPRIHGVSLHGIPALHVLSGVPRCQPSLSLREFSHCRHTPDDRHLSVSSCVPFQVSRQPCKSKIDQLSWFRHHLAQSVHTELHVESSTGHVDADACILLIQL